MIIYRNKIKLFNLLCVFIFLLPINGYNQTRYNSIEVSDMSEYGYRVENCYLVSYLKIKNITDSILIMKYTSGDDIGFLYGGGSIFLPPGYSYLKPVGLLFSEYDRPDFKHLGRSYLNIYKVDTSTYYSSDADSIVLESDIFEKVSVDFKIQSGSIRSIDPKSDTAQLKLNCPKACMEFNKWKTRTSADTNKIEIGGISEFGFYIKEYRERSTQSTPIQINIKDTSYNESANLNSICGILTIKNKSSDNIFVDKIVFDSPKGTYYIYKNGEAAKRGKKTVEYFNTATILDACANMNNYYIPADGSCAYSFSYTCYFNDKNISKDELLKRYNELPGRIYFNDGATMSFVLKFDKKYLMEQTKKIIWK